MARGLNVKSILEEVTRTGRKSRSPKHNFRVDHRPWEITPFMIAPVVPGESLKAALIQARAVTDPIKNPLIGWWLEHHLYFVKLTDIEDATFEEEGFFRNFVIDPSADLTAGGAYWDASGDGGARSSYHWKGYNFVDACLRTVRRSYFSDDNEVFQAVAWGTGVTSADGEVPVARLVAPGRENWMQSMMKDDSEVDPGVLTGADPDDPGVAAAYQDFYDRMVEAGATSLTYEDWLRSFGIKGAAVRRPGRPELLRYVRTWQLPSSHVSADTGALNSVISWNVDERVDKARFFKEPGFIFGVTLARPKVYLSNQTMNAATMMDHPFSWLPATLRDKPELGLKKFAAGAGPIGNSTAGYWVDIRDLFMYGDQFVNVALDSTGNNLVGGPALDMSTEKFQMYPSVADIEAMFASAAASGARAGRLVKQDGAVDLHFLTAESDPT